MSKELVMIVSGLIILFIALGWIAILSFTPSDLAGNTIQIILLLSLSFFLISVGLTKLER